MADDGFSVIDPTTEGGAPPPPGRAARDPLGDPRDARPPEAEGREGRGRDARCERRREAAARRALPTL